MALVPTSKIGRAVAAVWLLACVGMLLFAWTGQDVHDMPEAFIWLMIFLSFPLGYVAAGVFGIGAFYLLRSVDLPYHPFWSVVPTWVVITLAGYLQWFVLIPAIWRRFRARPRVI
jgi:hypothetical protein